MSKRFLPISYNEMKSLGWEEVDFAYITGDAYVDHPSFGTAIISRVLESFGYKVGIISQPDWKDKNSITLFGKPRLGFLVSAGNMDSMVNHYTAAKKKRSLDAYTPGGKIGKRPDRATIVYCNLIKQVYKDSPIIIGGIEASLRRLAHYDYWSDKLKRSVLLDSQADLLLYGMGEKSIVEVAQALDSGLEIKDITFIDGTVYKTKEKESIYDYQLLPSYNELLDNKLKYAESFMVQNKNTDPFTAKRLVEPYEDFYVVQNPPAKPLSSEEMDRVYSLPYMRDIHSSYKKLGGVDAIKEIKFSIQSARGCFGGCSFCSLNFHQGRIIQARSHESIINEAIELTKDKDFKGYINDVGGPTANFRQPACKKQLKDGVCLNRQCLFPTPCKNLIADHSDYTALLKKLRELPKVKKVFVRSGIRFDYLLCDKNNRFIRELAKHHISGQLKLAPEHISDNVLKVMGKPPHKVYLEFLRKYKQVNDELGLKQFVVPYLMSSHPGSTLQDAVDLAVYLKNTGHKPEQVQDFYPTPSTLSTVMYYTEVDPRTMKSVYVPKTPKEKNMQRALLQYYKPENYETVKEALIKAGRTDLIGNGKGCLIQGTKTAKKGQNPRLKFKKN